MKKGHVYSLHLTQFEIIASSIVVLFILLFCYSCNNQVFENRSSYLDYLRNEENGYLQKKEIQGVSIKLMYKPTDLMVAQELGDKPSQNQIEHLRSKYKDYLYFNLSMSKNNQELLSAAPNNRHAFSALVNQLSFGMRDVVHVYNDQRDTIQMADYLYPRMYGLNKSTDMLIVYPRDQSKLRNGMLTFSLQDLGLQTGDIKFRIPIEKFNNEPTLAFKQ